MPQTKNRIQKAEMPERWKMEYDTLCEQVMALPDEKGEWVKAEDVLTLVAQYNLLVQIVGPMIEKD
jgi:hypothetical protein